MAEGRRSLVAREGWLVIALAGLLALAVWRYFGGLWSLPLWGIMALLL
ncbi:MAG TPA: phosphatidylserine decarboxylase family protein, partial [Thiotrichales bacterium]|nr:phosphatidylserine decarboxylase family protein [Thiotrichales bacterium]